MKKHLSTALIITFILSFSACQSSPDENQGTVTGQDSLATSESGTGGE